MFYTPTRYSLALFTVILVSTALYILPPGYPQPGHVLALLLIVPFLFGLRSIVLGLPEKLLLIFWLYATGVNLVYWFIYRDVSFIVSTVYWTYGLVLFFAVRQVFLQQPQLGLGLPYALLAMLPVLVGLGLLGGDGFYRDGRFFGTFTDPNQMSYWLLCVFVASLSVSQQPNWFSPRVVFAIFVLVCFLFVLSSSRSAMLAAMVLLAAMVWWWLELGYAKRAPHGQEAVIRLPLIKVVTAFCGALLVLLMVLLVAYYLNSGVQEIIDNLIERSQKFGIWWQLEVRGYMRLVEFPQYLLFGAGQGFDGRFMEPLDGNVIYEVHSSIISPLFYYGIIGFSLLYTSFYLMARDRLQGWQWLVFAAPFVYGLFTYGLRTPVFWIMLASLYTIPLKAERANP